MLALAVLYVFVLLGTWPERPRVTWLLPFAWLYLAWKGIRHAPLFGIVAGFALADILPANASGPLPRPARQRPVLSSRPRRAG